MGLIKGVVALIFLLILVGCNSQQTSELETTEKIVLEKVEPKEQTENVVQSSPQPTEDVIPSTETPSTPVPPVEKNEVNQPIPQIERQLPELTEQEKKSFGNFIANYNQAFVTAINTDSFFYVENYLDPSGPHYAEQKKGIHEIAVKGIKEQVGKSELRSVERIDHQTYLVTTYDEFIIDYPNKSDRIQGFLNKHSIKIYGQEMKIYDCVENNRIMDQVIGS